jgi:ATP-dependent DNA helicase RecG
MVCVTDEETIPFEKKNLVVFYVPESPRSEKPVHLGNDIRNCYIRRGSGDERCTDEEMKRFIRDAGSVKYDSYAVTEILPDNFFDNETVSWYRRIFNQKEPERYATLNDIEFLHELGFIIEKDEKLFPIRAGILAFGKDKYVRQILNRVVVDFQRIDFGSDEWTPDLRWHDRITPGCKSFQNLANYCPKIYDYC